MNYSSFTSQEQAFEHSKKHILDLFFSGQVKLGMWNIQLLGVFIWAVSEETQLKVYFQDRLGNHELKRSWDVRQSSRQFNTMNSL